MQEYEMLLEDVVAQLKAGFAEMERRHQGKIAKLQQGHKEEIECIHHCYDDKIASVKYELDTERQKIIDLQKKLKCVQKELAQAEQVNDYYKSRYDGVEKIDALIHNLSENTFEGVMSAFGCQTDDDCMKLLFGIVQEKHLDSAWLYMSNAINEGLASAQDREIFKEVMTFAIHAVAGVDKVAAYEIIMAEPGQGFDAGCMGRAKDSSQLGKVQEVLLPGYRYVGSGKVVHPALVLLRKS